MARATNPGATNPGATNPGAAERRATRPGAAERQASERAQAASPAAGLLAAVIASKALMAVVTASLSGFFRLDLDQAFRLSTGAIGIVLAIAQGVPAVAYILAPILVKRFGSYRLAILPAFAASLAMVPVGLAGRWLAAAGGFTATQFVVSLGDPAYTYLCQQSVAPKARAVLAGVMNASWGITAAAVGFVGGSLIQRFGYGRFFLAGSLAQALGVAIIAVYFRRGAQRPVVAPAA
jgi:predicted MFS family arabinose efflux permease